jgi:uncharacterized protein GlcG (DUF336 family)
MIESQGSNIVHKERDLGIEQAWGIAANALAMLKEKGWDASGCLVNKSGRVLVQFHMNQSRGAALSVAGRKAWQSVHTGLRTGFLSQMVESGQRPLGVLGIDPDKYCPLAGGVPIYGPDNQLVGGMGMSNLEPHQDEEIAIRAVEKAGLISEFPSISKLTPKEDP